MVKIGGHEVKRAINKNFSRRGTWENTPALKKISQQVLEDAINDLLSGLQGVDNNILAVLPGGDRPDAQLRRLHGRPPPCYEV